MNHTPPPTGMMRMASGKLVPMSKPFGANKAVVRRLLIALSYYEGDREAAEDLLTLLAELERTRNREADILLVRRADAREINPNVRAKLALKFNNVLLHTCRRTDARGYPHAPNQMWSDLVTLMAHSAPFATEYYGWLNLETDVVPTRPGWIGELVAEWQNVSGSGKAAMGFIHNDPSPHLNGMAVYSPDILKRVPQLIGSSPQICYDIWQAKRVLPHAHGTPLIRFDYRKATITADELFADEKVCLYHGVKDASARQAVRARHVTFTDKPTQKLGKMPENVFVTEGSQSLAVTEVQDPTKFEVPSLDEPPSTPSTIPALVAAIQEKKKEVVAHFEKTAPPTVYTYAHKHDGVTKQELAAILEAWKKGWKSSGWNPVVLTLRDAASHIKFSAFQAAIEKLPCVGDRKRMAHRFYRWLALDSVGGGMMVDYDVLPAVSSAEFHSDSLAFSLTKEESANWIDLLIKYDAQPEDMFDGKPHVSDKELFCRKNHVSVMTGQLKHFNQSTVGTGKKSVAMEKFLEGR